MPNSNRQDLSDYRLNKARECLNDAHALMGLRSYAACANRSYYVIFHAIRATLALEELDFKKHSAVIGKFRELYIKTNIFDDHYSKIIG